MRSADIFAFAARALRGHRLRTLLTLLGMTIGVAAVILLTALGGIVLGLAVSLYFDKAY